MLILELDTVKQKLIKKAKDYIPQNRQEAFEDFVNLLSDEDQVNKAFHIFELQRIIQKVLLAGNAEILLRSAGVILPRDVTRQKMIEWAILPAQELVDRLTAP